MPSPTPAPHPGGILIEATGNYTIEQVPDIETAVEVVMKVPKGFPLDKEGFRAQPVVKDIASNWQFGEGPWLDFGISSTGIGRASDPTMPAGDWVLRDGVIAGRWGNAVVMPDWYGLTFPVRDGWASRITITVGQLRIGLLDSQNGHAIIDRHIDVLCQGKDIAGKIIADTNCDPGYALTDETGVATFYLGPGTYFAVVDGGLYDQPGTYPDIQLSVGEEKQLILSFP